MKVENKPQMNWKATHLRREWTRFKPHCQFTFKGPSASKQEKELVNYLMTYIGDNEGHIYTTFVLANDEENMLEPLYEKFKEYVELKHDQIWAPVKFDPPSLLIYACLSKTAATKVLNACSEMPLYRELITKHCARSA